MRSIDHSSTSKNFNCNYPYSVSNEILKLADISIGYEIFNLLQLQIFYFNFLKAIVGMNDIFLLKFF